MICHWCQPSMPNSVVGARTRTIFTWTKRWRTDRFGFFFFWGFFRVEECMELIWPLYIGVNVSFNLRCQAYPIPYTGSVREIGRFPQGVLPTTRICVLERVWLLLKKNISRNILFVWSTKTQGEKGRRGKYRRRDRHLDKLFFWSVDSRTPFPLDRLIIMYLLLIGLLLN